jgi:hypothetical protein
MYKKACLFVTILIHICIEEYLTFAGPVPPLRMWAPVLQTTLIKKKIIHVQKWLLFCEHCSHD